MAKKSKGKRRIFHWHCQNQRTKVLRGIVAIKAIASGKAVATNAEGTIAEMTGLCNHASKANGTHNVANHPIADFGTMSRFCPLCRGHFPHKMKEPKSGAAGLAKSKNKK